MSIHTLFLYYSLCGAFVRVCNQSTTLFLSSFFYFYFSVHEKQHSNFIICILYLCPVSSKWQFLDEILSHGRYG